MLSIPVFAEVEGITVFRDDTDPSRFYYLAKEPRILRDQSGKPMFTFLRYQFPIEREGSEPGGGYLVFTTAMRADPLVLNNKVKPVLQRRLRSELPPGVAMPEIVLAPVDFTDGEVRLIIMQNDQFVKNITLGKPSLFADNTASVAVELSADAATLFYESLRRGGSIAAIEYNLRFPVRLPAITIIGHVDSREVKEVVMTYTEQTVTDGSVWGDDSREERQRTSIAETMESQGLIKLEILKGSVDLAEDDMESLRAFAFRAMDEFIKAHFLKGGSVETDADRRSQWMEFLSQDINVRFDLNVSYRDVITREYNPSAQINPSFLGGRIEDMVHDIDLGNAPWYFNNLEVTVDTNLDFERYGDIVHSVVGHLSYDQHRPDGTRVTKRESVPFTKDNARPRPKAFRTRLAEVGKDNYHVEVEVNYKAGPQLKAILGSFNTTTRHLTLNVPNPGVIEINFGAAPDAFSGQLKGVEVEVAYEDRRNNVPRAVEAVLLNADKPEAVYRRVIYAPWEQPFRYRYTYILQDDSEDGAVQRSTTPWMDGSSETRHVKIPTPFDQEFRLTVIPSVDWNEVRELIVDVAYSDEDNDYSVQNTMSFSNEGDSTRRARVWKFPLRNPDRRGYRFAQKLLLQNDGVTSVDWQTRESDLQALIVGNAPGGVVTLEVDPSDVGIGDTVVRAIVQLRYADPANNKLDTQTLLFRDTMPQQWTVSRADATRNDYTYSVTYFLSEGNRRVVLANQQGTFADTTDFLFLPPPPDQP